MNKFSILRFSPDPEEVEYVNVAIWLEPGRMIYDPEFPKLKCVAPGYDTSLLQFYLDDLHEHFRRTSATALAEVLASRSSQFIVTKPRVFHSSLSDRAIRELERRYLQKHHVAGKTRTEVEQHVETRLHELLVGMHIPSEHMLKRAEPSSFLSPRVQKVLGPNGFRISRVLNGRTKLVLIDGINFMLRNRDYIERRANEISYAYYRIGAMKDAIRTLEGREARRAIVVFGADQAKDEPRFQYTLTVLDRESDHIVHAERPPSREFVQDAFEAAKVLF